MTEQEFIKRVELLEEATKGLPTDSQNIILVNSMHELVYAYFRGKKSISRDVYERIGKYFKDITVITAGDIQRRECERLSEFYDTQIAELRESMIHLDNNPVILCASFDLCREYIPDSIWDSDSFMVFHARWERRIKFYDSDEFYSKYNHYYIEPEDYKEFSGPYYRKIFEALIQASYKYYEAKGYFRYQKKHSEIWAPYNNMCESERNKVVAIRGSRFRIERTKTLETYRLKITD